MLSSSLLLLLLTLLIPPVQHPTTIFISRVDLLPLAHPGAPAAICRGAKVGATKVGANLGGENGQELDISK
jgi:hypothetical protein